MANFSDLPPRARERANALKNAADTHFAAVRGLSQQLRDLKSDRDQIDQRIRCAVDPRFYGGAAASENDPNIKSMRAYVDDLTAEIARVTASLDAQTVSADVSILARRAEEYLRGLRPGHAMADSSIAPPSLKKGETLSDAIEARRRRVSELLAERERVEAAPLPAAEAKQLAREQISQLAERGRADVAPLLERGDPFRFAHLIALTKSPQDVGEVHIVNTAATLAWLFRDHLSAAIDALIDTRADDKHALSDRQRAARLEQLGREQLAVEREEAVLVEMAAAQGLTIPHRGDIDVRALLGVEISPRAEAA